MRIIGGRLGGRTLPAGVPKGARPTSDRVREAIASALEARAAIGGAQVLDLFAGSGALGLEALSRDAASLVSVDQHSGAARAIAQNAKALGLEVQVSRLDLLAEPQRVSRKLAEMGRGPFTLVFADPPYAQAAASGALLDALASAGLLAAGAFVVLESAHAQPPAPPQRLTEVTRYRYGDTAVALYSFDG